MGKMCSMEVAGKEQMVKQYIDRERERHDMQNMLHIT